jgi:hypothetical protein
LRSGPCPSAYLRDILSQPRIWFQGKVLVENQKLEVVTPAAKETMAMGQVGAIRNADEQKAWERLQSSKSGCRGN